MRTVLPVAVVLLFSTVAARADEDAEKATAVYLDRFHRLRRELIEAARPLQEAMLAWHLAEGEEGASDSKAVRSPGSRTSVQPSRWSRW